MTQLLVAIAAVLLVAWFAAGTVRNVQLGRNLMRWMQDGLPLLGERTTLRWLGSTAVEMAIAEAKAPFVRATVVIFLEPRDLPWMWALGRAGGRRDTLIVRGALRTTPRDELEVLAAGSWSSRDAARRMPRDWTRTPAQGEPTLEIHHAGAAALERAQALIALGRAKGLAPRRLSVRRDEPQFQLHLAFPDRTCSAGDFFEAVRAVAQRAVE